MTLQTYPVKIEHGVIETVDGSSLPERAYALLVLLPEASGEVAAEEWRRPFDRLLATIKAHPASKDLEQVGDEELTALIHQLRNGS